MGLVPEEKLSLGEFFLGRLCRVDRFQCVWLIARVPCLGGNGHGRGREVLYLFQLEVETFGDDGQFCHVLFAASRMAADEVGDNLLLQVFLLVDSVEDALELLKLCKRWFSHQVENGGGSVFWCHFQSAAHVVANQFACIDSCRLIHLFVLAAMEEQVVAHTTANEALLHARQTVDGMIDVE